MFGHSGLRNELIKIFGEGNYSYSELDAVSYANDAATGEKKFRFRVMDMPMLLNQAL